MIEETGTLKKTSSATGNTALGGILLQLYKFMEQKIKTIFYNVNFLIISNFIPFKMCKK